MFVMEKHSGMKPFPLVCMNLVEITDTRSKAASRFAPNQYDVITRFELENCCTYELLIVNINSLTCGVRGWNYDDCLVLGVSTSPSV